MERELVKNLTIDLNNNAWEQHLLMLKPIGIDPKITFGVELETYNREIIYDDLYGIKPSEGWKVDEEPTIAGGVEFVSPVLSDTEFDLNNLHNLLEVLKKYNYTETPTCGGHIHLGANYIKSIQELKFLLNLYSSMEDIIALISQRKGTTVRKGAENFSLPIKYRMEYINSLKEKKFIFHKQYDKYLKECQKLFGCRFYSLNISHIGTPNKNTIEFRIPNGEIDYNELINNVRLFAKLLESIKKYNISDISDIKQSDRNKLKILMDMLFYNSEYRSIYEERYDENLRKTIIEKEKKEKSK